MVEVMKKVSGNYEENAMVARKKFPGAVVLDVTIDGAMGKLDPGFRWEKVRVPGKENERGLSLKGVIEGLKLFGRKNEDDERWWKEERFVGKERNYKSYGKLRGFKIGEIEVGVEKGKEIFENVYRDEVEMRFGFVIESLKKLRRPIVLLDYMEEDGRKVIDHVRVLKELIECKEMKDIA